eukprot:1771934-Amphidinium_carterae.1
MLGEARSGVQLVRVMGDPADFSLVYTQACPAGAASIAAAATMLSLMTNPVLFYKFANLLTHVLRACHNIFRELPPICTISSPPVLAS